MRSTVAVLLLVLALLAPAVPAVAEEGQKNPTAEEASDRGRGGGDDDADEDRGGRPDDAGRGRGDEMRPPTPIHIGNFSLDTSSGEATGEYVTFRYDRGAVRSFTADGTPFFHLTPADDRAETIHEVGVRGSRMEVEADTYRLVVHDNPAAVSKIKADRPVSLELLGEAEITRVGEDRHYAFTIGNLSGRIKGDHVVLNGSRLVAEGEILVLLDSVRASADSHRPALMDAIAKGRVGAEASFNKEQGKLEQDVVSYGNVTMTTVRAERGNLTVLVEGHGFDGRVLVLNVDGRVVGASKEGDLNILFDNQSMRRADSLADALDPDDDGLQPEYYLVFDPATEAFQLVVSVPHYSVHTLSVTTVSILPPPSVVFGVLAGVALLVPAAFALFGRRRG